MCKELTNFINLAKTEEIKSELILLYKAYGDINGCYGLHFNDREWDSLIANILEGKMSDEKKVEYNLKY